MIVRTVRHPTPTPSRLRRDTSPPNDGGEEAPAATQRAFPLPLSGGEVARRAGVGVVPEWSTAKC